MPVTEPDIHGAGSIRIPASFCHLYGIKPSRGRVPDGYGRPDRTAIAIVGPMARNVADAAALLDVMSGLCVGTPHWAPVPDCHFAEAARRPPPPLKVRFTTRSPLVSAHPEVDEAVHRVASLLAAQGHHVEEGPPPEGALEEFLPVWQFLVAKPPVLRRASLQPVTAWLREPGKRLRAADVLARQHDLARRRLAAAPGGPGPARRARAALAAHLFAQHGAARDVAGALPALRPRRHRPRGRGARDGGPPEVAAASGSSRRRNWRNPSVVSAPNRKVET
jgi:Asp-tRNA(Asn)/Glu-tRNA(Gln) amidotransferase A subunit family amidase